MRIDRWVRARVTLGAVALLLVWGIGGCGNLTAGGAPAQVLVALVADGLPPAPTAAALARPFGVGGEPGRASDDDSDDDGDDDPEGEIELEFDLALIADDGSVVPVSSRSVRVTAEFPGQAETRLALASVAAARYVALRVVFTELEVEVDAGLVIGGREVTGPIDVELESDSLVVERPLELELDEDETAELIIDLNASAWLVAVDPDLQTVAGRVVAEQIRVIQR